MTPLAKRGFSCHTESVKNKYDNHIQGRVTMTSITYVWLDVHTTNYTAACYRFETDNTFAVATLKPKVDEIVKHLNRVKKGLGVNFALAAPLARSFCTTVTEKQHHPHGETAPPSRTSCTTENIDYTQRKWYHKRLIPRTSG